MPRWVSRITLEILNVKIKRLQEISISDAIAEGFESLGGYQSYWDRLNRDNADKCWHADPWVWVINFKKL